MLGIKDVPGDRSPMLLRDLLLLCRTCVGVVGML